MQGLPVWPGRNRWGESGLRAPPLRVGPGSMEERTGDVSVSSGAWEHTLVSPWSWGRRSEAAGGVS